MITPRVATGTVARDDRSRVLLIRRGPDAVNGAGEWSLPGGKLDPMETLEQGAGRELTEEVGIIAVMRSLGIITEDMDWGPDLHFVTHYFQAMRWTGVARIMEPHKHDAIDWFEQDRLIGAATGRGAGLVLFPPTRGLILAGGLDALI